MINFLFFPREVRQMIYDYALIVGKVYPHVLVEAYLCNGTMDKEPERPTANLLKTCRLINREASPILYSKNTFVLPMSALTQRFFEHALDTSDRRAWVKSVVLRLDPGDLDESDRREVVRREIEELGDSLAEFGNNISETLYTCGGDLHRAFKKRLGDICWPRKVKPVLDYLALDDLTLDFYFSTCPDECCPMAYTALAAMKPGFAYGMPASLDFADSSPFDPKKFDRYLRLWTDIRRGSHLPLEQGLELDKDFRKEVEYEGNDEGKWAGEDFNRRD
ncbi:hypothetical protein MMC13_000448 [Lambiella insularis]|nr:hypothetical protein [Lambiella insularis]